MIRFNSRIEDPSCAEPCQGQLELTYSMKLHRSERSVGRSRGGWCFVAVNVAVHIRNREIARPTAAATMDSATRPEGERRQERPVDKLWDRLIVRTSDDWLQRTPVAGFDWSTRHCRARATDLAKSGMRMMLMWIT